MNSQLQYWIEAPAFSQFQQYFNQFLESLPLGLIWLDQKGVIKKINQLSKMLLGCESNPLGQLWREVIQQCVVPENRPGYEVVLKNGRRLDVSTQAVPSLENPVQLEQIIILSDVTETRRLQQQVDQQDRLKELGMISATLSHQLKTPLATCLLYTDQLRHYDLPKAKRQAISTTIAGQLQYMNRQVNDLLFFVKGDLPVDRTQTIADVIDGILQLNKSELHDYKIEVKVSDIDVAESVTCHFDALIGALSNLISNACEASVPGSPVRLAIRRMQCQQSGRGFFYFDVIDQGEGFDAKARYCFGKKAYSTKQTGSGIGLRFAATVAEKHGGKLLLCPQINGSCVSISIPHPSSIHPMI